MTSRPSHAPPYGRFATRLFPVLAVAALSACGTASPVSTPAVKSTPTPTQEASTAGQEICGVSGRSGSYYLLVTSATDHNFKACDNAVQYTGTLDDLFKLPGMDRRCILGDAYTSANDALVAVYSDTKPDDLAAADAFCRANGGTQNG